jgi:hypothetical protein
MVKGGRVEVGGRVVRDPDLPCHPERNKILVDGKRLREERKIYIVLRKPVGYVTTARDPERRSQPTTFSPRSPGAGGPARCRRPGLSCSPTTPIPRPDYRGGGGEKASRYCADGSARDASLEKGVLRRTENASRSMRDPERGDETTIARLALREGRNRRSAGVRPSGPSVVSLHRARALSDWRLRSWLLLTCSAEPERTGYSSAGRRWDPRRARAGTWLATATIPRVASTPRTHNRWSSFGSDQSTSIAL